VVVDDQYTERLGLSPLGRLQHLAQAAHPLIGRKC
jgi:hypothetical protein